jgi:hypothetical protein
LAVLAHRNDRRIPRRAYASAAFADVYVREGDSDGDGNGDGRGDGLAIVSSGTGDSDSKEHRQRGVWKLGAQLAPD